MDHFGIKLLSEQVEHQYHISQESLNSTLNLSLHAIVSIRLIEPKCAVKEKYAQDAYRNYLNRWRIMTSSLIHAMNNRM